MSNRFTKYTADKLRADGWLDKEQADALRTRLQQVESDRDEAEADAAVMREALLDEREEIIRGGRHHVEERRMGVIDQALATNAGKSLLLRLQEAEWLLDHCPDSLDPNPMVNKQWWSRRDTFLNPKPQQKG